MDSASSSRLSPPNNIEFSLSAQFYPLSLSDEQDIAPQHTLQIYLKLTACLLEVCQFVGKNFQTDGKNKVIYTMTFRICDI